MPRPLRCDRPDALHHVTNRGPGHRPLFASDADVRVFLGLLARAVRKGLLEVHAYSLLATHFHLLVGSREGTLARGLGWVEDLYARYFNRTRDRDGHAFKGRYFARRIDDLLYLAMVIAYIDRNAVAAGMVSHPAAYPHASAKHYVGLASPPWLRRDIVEKLACQIGRTNQFSPEAYAAIWAACTPLGGDALVAQAVRRPRVPLAPIMRLICAGPQSVQDWMLECAKAEEGSKGVALVIAPSQFEEVERELPKELTHVTTSGVSIDMRGPLVAGLLRTLTGMTMQEIAVHMGISLTRAFRWIGGHKRALVSDAAYARVATRAVEASVQRAYGPLAIMGRSA